MNVRLSHGVDPTIVAVARRRQEESWRQIARMRGGRHEARRQAVLDSVRSRHVPGEKPRHTLMGRLFGH
jgi:hypothetical protein